MAMKLVLCIDQRAGDGQSILKTGNIFTCVQTLPFNGYFRILSLGFCTVCHREMQEGSSFSLSWLGGGGTFIFYPQSVVGCRLSDVDVV